MRSFFFSATSILILGSLVACGDDTSGSGSGGDDTSSSSGDATTTTSGSPTSTTNGSGGDPGPGTGGEGGTDPSTTSAGGEGGGTSGDGGAGGDGSGGGTGGSGGEAASTYFGRVLFSNGYYGVDDVSVDGGVSGTFSEITSAGDPDGCVETVDGDCTLILCPPFEGNPQATAPRLAGDLTVDGTLVEAPIVYDEKFDYYGFYIGGELIYASGDELSVDATGDDVPAFTGSVVAPAHATLTSPSSDDLVFSLDEDLDFTWDVEGTGGRLLASLDVYNDDGSYAILYCDWPMDDGAASMPAAFMAEMPPTDGALLSMYDWAVSSVEAGDWVIEVAVQGTTQGDSESGTASFEGVVLE
jgi:hypothetical protein